MKNIEVIKKMNTDELAEFLTDFDCYKSCEHDGRCKTRSNCINGLKKYLESEAKSE